MGGSNALHYLNRGYIMGKEDEALVLKVKAEKKKEQEKGVKKTDGRRRSK